MGFRFEHANKEIMVGTAHLNVGIYDPNSYERGGQNIGRVHQIREIIRFLDDAENEEEEEKREEEEEVNERTKERLKIICSDTNADADTSPEMLWWVTPVLDFLCLCVSVNVTLFTFTRPLET